MSGHTAVLGTLIAGVVVAIAFMFIVRQRVDSPSNSNDSFPVGCKRSAQPRAGSRTNTFDFAAAVDLAHQLLPSVKIFLKEILIHRFLRQWYIQELNHLHDKYGDIMAWSAVAHSSPPTLRSSSSEAADFDKASFHLYPTMNIAFPDLSAEYYLTFIPALKAAIFQVSFPDWMVYGALTLYDSYGLPISSVNSRDLDHYANGKEKSKCVVMNLECATEEAELASSKRKIWVNLFKDCLFKENCVVVYRVYRPAGVDITPASDFPTVFFINRADAHTFSPTLTKMNRLTMAARPDAFEAGKRIEAFFSKLMVGKLREPTPDLYGCQFYHPAAVVGCFPNLDAVYVLAWLPLNMHGMKIDLRVPYYSPHRPYYGIMAIDHHSTATLSSLTYEEMGGWGAQCTVFAVRTSVDEARAAGYDSNDSSHRLLTWGSTSRGPLGAVLRYIHFIENESIYNSSSSDSLYNKEENSAANLNIKSSSLPLAERKNLAELDGSDFDNTTERIPGLGRIQYF